MTAVKARRLRSGTTHAVLILFSALALLPFVSILFISVYPADQPASGLALPHSINLADYSRAWKAGNFATLLQSSTIVAVCVVTLASVLCILSGYAFGTMTFPGKNPLFILFLLGLLLPFEAVIIPLYYDERSVGLTNTYPGLILPEAALFLSFGTFWMRAHFLSTPRPLIEAARLDGSNSWTTLWRVLVPNARAPINAMLVLFFIWSWNEFLLALVLAQDPKIQTAPAGLSFFFGEHTTDTSTLAAAAIIVTTPVLIVYVLLQRRFIQGVTSGSVR